MREVVELAHGRRTPTPRERTFDRKVRVIIFVAIGVVLTYYVLEWLMLHGYF